MMNTDKIYFGKIYLQNDNYYNNYFFPIPQYYTEERMFYLINFSSLEFKDISSGEIHYANRHIKENLTIDLDSLMLIRDRFPSISFPTKISNKDISYINTLFYNYSYFLKKNQDINLKIKNSYYQEMIQRISKRFDSKPKLIKKIFKY